MSHDNVTQKLIRMANQIATFFKSQPADTRLEGIATHINKFWEPRMRRRFFELVDHGGEGLDRLVLDAAVLVKRPNEESGPGVGSGAAANSSKGKGSIAGEALSEATLPE
ncbi:formate dehydrogenase subunit delta [Agrobacterium sp. ES01]|uniref:formate dehydrogenase subunit delta n=1 Tax=Agrobacterium sp. ES01 TaxID=3420714 RepID=UPI003D11DC7F